MKKTYIALVQQASDGTYAISFPDLCGVYAQAATLDDVSAEASGALASFLLASESVSLPIPAPSASVTHTDAQMAVIVTADTDAYARAHDTEPVRKTVSLPAWMVNQASRNGISLSKTLQDALRSRFGGYGE